MISLGNMLKEHNAYAKVFRQAASLHNPDATIMLRCASNVDPRFYNVPQVNEVAAFILGGTNLYAPRQILVHLRTGGVKRITDLHSAYDPLHYVLLLPRGEQGRTTDIQLRTPAPRGWSECTVQKKIQLRKEQRPVRGAPVEGDHGTPMTRRPHNTVGARAFAAFYLLQRPTSDTGNFLQRPARLYEAYIVDQYCKATQHTAA